LTEPSPPFSNPDPTPEQMLRQLRYANDIARRARQFGHHPFGATLVAPDHETVLLTQGNVDTVNHAESVLVRTAATNFSPDFLWNCTLYTTAEPCVMCAGTLYWGNIGRLVYGIAETALLELTGNDPQNPTLDVPCRLVFEKGQKPIRVWGPFEEVRSEVIAVHRDFWQGKAD
jgi:tRNA(Arg) A34 adenosine deaminase TadA